MFFANATYTSQEFGKLIIAICTDEDEEHLWDGREDGIFRVQYTKPIAEAVLRAAAVGVLPVDFSCNDVQYSLIKYNARPEERFYNQYRKNHVVRKARIVRNTEIYVCSERCRCTPCFGKYGFDSLENVCGLVKLRDDPQRIVEIDVQHCTRCGNYFIDKESLALYEHRYGLLSIIKRHITGNETEAWGRSSITYKENTVLSRNGYSTSLYTHERRAILVGIMRRGVSKAEIKDVLSRFISQRSERCPDAASVWRADLEFVNDYELDSEKLVRFS